MVKDMFGYVSFLILKFSGYNWKTNLMILFHLNQTNAIGWLRRPWKARQIAYSVAEQNHNISQFKRYFLPASINLDNIINR